MGWEHTAYHIIDSDPGHTLWKQQLDKYLKITFASPPKSTDEKGEIEGKKERQSVLRYTQAQLMKSKSTLRNKKWSSNFELPGVWYMNVL